MPRLLAVLLLSPALLHAAPLLRGTGTPEPQMFMAGSRADFTVGCQVLETLPVDSEIRVVTPREGSWSRPSLDVSKEPENKGAFVDVSWELAGSDGTVLEASCEKWSDRGPPYTAQDVVRQLRLKVTKRALQAGARLTVKFPNSRISNRCLLADPVRNESRYLLQVLPAGSEEWQDIEGLPSYGVHPEAPFRVEVLGRTQVVVGDAVPLSLAVLDRFGNPAVDYEGTVTFSSSDPNAKIGPALNFKAGAQAIGEGTITFATPGLHKVVAEAGQALEGATQSAMQVEVLATAPPLRLYWAELHVHGNNSYDARNWGGCMMTPHDMLDWGRRVAGLDVAAVTDHSMHNGRLTQQNMTGAQFQQTQEAAKELNDPGRYVTLTACEQRCARGDTNVYFLQDNADYYMKDSVKTIQELWGIYQNDPIISIPHQHPQVKRPERFDEIDPTKEKLAEIHSNHGRYEYHENEPLKPAKGMVDGNNVQALLARGHRLGVVCASDDHSGRPGQTDVTGIYAKELTRPAIFEALQQRHTFGSTGVRLNIMFRMGDAMMGDEVLAAAGDPLMSARRLKADILAVQDIERAEIVRNGKVIYAKEGNGPALSFEFADTQPLDQCYLGTEKNGNPPTAYYYLRVTLPRENRYPVWLAWSSPIFVSPK